MDPALLRINDRHGLWLRREAEELGYDDRAVSRLVRSEVWHRVRWGAYTYEDIWRRLTALQQYSLLCRAAYRRTTTEVVLSHSSAANEWDAPMWEADLATVHLTRADEHTQRIAAGVRSHRGRILEGDVVERNGVLVMNPTRTALELTTLDLDTEHVLVEIDSLVHRGLTTVAEIRDRYALMTHWPATLRTDLLLSLVDGASESVGETRLRYLCWVQGLPTPEVNFPVRNRAGKVVYRVDLAWPELGVFVEFDGDEKYRRLRREGESVTDTVLREKKRESTICELTGWRCIRVVWADLYRAKVTADRIRAQFRPVAA